MSSAEPQKPHLCDLVQMLYQYLHLYFYLATLRPWLSIKPGMPPILDLWQHTVYCTYHKKWMWKEYLSPSLSLISHTRASRSLGRPEKYPSNPCWIVIKSHESLQAKSSGMLITQIPASCPWHGLCHLSPVVLLLFIPWEKRDSSLWKHLSCFPFGRCVSHQNVIRMR